MPTLELGIRIAWVPLPSWSHASAMSLTGRASRHESGKWLFLAEVQAMQSSALNSCALTGNEVSMRAFDMGLGML